MRPGRRTPCLLTLAGVGVGVWVLGCGGRVGTPRPVIQPPPGTVTLLVPIEEGGGSPDSGYAPSIAVGATGAIGVSFYDAGRGILRFAELVSGAAWSVQDVDGPDAGFSSSLRYLPNAPTPYIAYGFRSTQDLSGGLRAAYRDDQGVWHTRTLDAGPPAESPSMGIDARGVVRVAYLQGGRGLRYLDWDRGNGIDLQTADSGNPPVVFLPPSQPDQWAGLVLMPDALPVVVYYEATQGDVGVARLDPNTGSWDRSRVEWIEVRNEPAAVEPNAFLEGGPCDIQPPYYVVDLQHPSSADPQRTVLVRDGTPLAPQVWQFCSVNQLGILPEAYQAGASYTVDYDRTDATSDDEGEFVSAFADVVGTIYASYFDRSRLVLKYAQEEPTGWTTEIVDASGQVGAGSAVALDSLAHPVIVYRSLSELALKLAHRRNGRWEVRFIDAGGDTGEQPAMSSGPGGMLAVAYRGTQNGQAFLKILEIPPGVLEGTSP